MKLNFVTIAGKQFSIGASPKQTIQSVKEKIASNNKIKNPNNLEFIYNSKRLENTEIIENLKINPDVYIILHNTNQYADFPQNSQPNQQSILVKKRSFRESDDPPNFDQQIARLAELGYPPRRCADALRAANYDVEAAAIMLIDKAC